LSRTKVICILTHSPSPNSKKNIEQANIPKNYVKVDYGPKWLGFFDVDWHVQVMENLGKVSDKFLLECWRPYELARESHSMEINSIKHRIFPSKVLRFRDKFIWEKSSIMLKEIDNEISNSSPIIILLGPHTPLALSILRNVKNCKIMGMHVGGLPAEYQFKNGKSILARLFSFPKYLVEQGAYNKLDYSCGATFTQKSFMKKYCENSVLYHPLGVNPPEPKHSKAEYRDLLNIGQDKKVLLYVGRLWKKLGVVNNIKIFKSLKSLIPELELYLVGGYKSDELYDFCVGSGANIVQRIPKEKLFGYYFASDMYLDLRDDTTLLNAGGIGIALTEAVLSGLPVVSTGLIHLGNLNDSDKTLDINKLFLHNPKSLGSALAFIYNFFSQPTSNNFDISNYKDLYSWSKISKRLDYILSELATE